MGHTLDVITLGKIEFEKHFSQIIKPIQQIKIQNQKQAQLIELKSIQI